MVPTTAARNHPGTNFGNRLGGSRPGTGSVHNRRSEVVPDVGNQLGTGETEGGSPVPPLFRAEPGTGHPADSPRNCCPCGRPTAGASLCGTCRHTLETALTDIASYWLDLDLVRSRQTRYGGNGGRSAEQPLAIDARFAHTVWTEGPPGVWLGRTPDGTALIEAVRDTITTWTRYTLAHRPTLAGPTCPTCLHISCAHTRRSRPPRDTIPSCCHYLAGHGDWHRTANHGPDLLDEATHLAGQLRRLVDRPPEAWPAGPCDDCGHPLHAALEELRIRCRNCGRTYQARDRRDRLLAVAEDRLVPAVTIARAVSWLGEHPLTAERVRQWKRRQQLVVRAYEPQPGEIGPASRTRPLYRLGDALDLLADAARKVG